ATSADRVTTLAASNTLTVQVTGAKGTTLTVSAFTLVMPKPVSLTPSPLALTAGRAQGTLSATLSPAPTAAGSLTVTSANPAIAAVPASVALAWGQPYAHGGGDRQPGGEHDFRGGERHRRCAAYGVLERPGE